MRSCSEPARPPVASLEDDLAEVARSVERELRPRLTGFLGGMIRAYLPQTWEFRTEDAAFYLVVGKDGSVRLAPAATGPLDVTVTTTRELLHRALVTRQKGAIPPGGLTVTTHTTKGRTAFDTLRSRLGL
jgi:hypothetical protein